MKCRVMGKTVEIPDERMRTVTATDAVLTKQGAVRTAQVLPLTSPLPGWPKPTDKWNYSFCQFLEMEKQAGRIKCWFYEPFSIWLVRPDKATKEKGIRHKVDFMIWYPDGLERKLEMVEVKGNGYRNLRDGITRYKLAKQMLPCFDWRMVKRERGGWVDY